MQPSGNPRQIKTDDVRGLIRAGDTIVVGQGGAEPTLLTRTLIEEAARIGDVTVILGLTLSDTFPASAPVQLHFASYGGLGRNAALAKAGRLAVIPCHYSQLPALFRKGHLRADCVLMQVAPPRHGRGYAFGAVYETYLAEAARQARVVIAEVNPNAPSIPGGELPPDLRIDALVDSDAPLVALGAARMSEVETRVARHVAGLVPDGATIQLGIGALPDAILRELGGHKHLGIHSGMLTDAALPLIEAGVVDNSKKRFDAGVTVSGIFAGSEKFYRFLDGNPAFRLAPSDETHGIASLARIPDFFSLNSAIEVDLHGQVNAEVAAGLYLGCFGGQVDFARGAAASEGGLSVIALSSTTKDGKTSRIVADLSGPVTTSAADVDCVVTEWGVARLKGASFAERRRRLLAIAHPDFRAVLGSSSA